MGDKVGDGVGVPVGYPGGGVRKAEEIQTWGSEEHRDGQEGHHGGESIR